MKWDYKAEVGAKAALKYYLCQQRLPHQYAPESVKGLIFGNSMDIFYELLTGMGGRRRNYFLLDGTFEKFIFLTGDKHSDFLLKLLCDGSIQKELNSIWLAELKERNMAAKCDVCGKMVKNHRTTCHGDIICSKTCHYVCIFESYLARLENKRERAEPLNRQVYDNAREMSGVISLYKYGNKEVSKNAAKIIDKYYDFK